MIRKLLLSLGLIGLGIINFSSASPTLGTVGSYIVNPYYSNLDVNVINHGQFLTEEGGIIKNIFYTNEFGGFFWGPDGIPYAFVRNSNSATQPTLYQGYIGQYSFCDVLNSSSTTFSGCSAFDVDSYSSGTFAEFLSTVKFSDYFLFDGTYSSSSSTRTNYICISSSSLNKSLCFSSCYSRLTPFNGCPAGFPVSNLHDSLGLTYTGVKFADIDSSLLYDPPGWGGNIPVFTGGVGTGITLECTKQNALNRYNKKGYTSKLCYGGYDDFVINDGTPLGYLPFWGSGLDYQEIWLETANLLQGGSTGSATSLDSWFIYWRAMYDLYKRGGFDVNPFINTPWVLFTYFGAVETYGRTFLSKDIIEYCDLLLYTSDYTSSYTGGLNSDLVCDPINLVSDSASGIGIIAGVNIVGTGEVIYDGENFIENYFNLVNDKLGSLDGSDSSPILPSYIILALLGLVLFRFLSH